jgi:hypothetical protein
VKAIRMHAALVLVVLLVSGTFPAAAQQGQVPPDTRIQLERTVCFGMCPAYSVSIDAQGNVTFEGKEFVRVKGVQTDRIPISKVRALLEMADRISFFEMHDHYRAAVTDLPTRFVTVTVSGRSKRIDDYFGAPKELRDFEREIDLAAGTKRWVRIDEQMLRELARDGKVSRFIPDFDRTIALLQGAVARTKKL